MLFKISHDRYFRTTMLNLEKKRLLLSTAVIENVTCIIVYKIVINNIDLIDDIYCRISGECVWHIQKMWLSFVPLIIDAIIDIYNGVL